MLAQRLSNIIKYPIYKAKLSLTDPYNGNNTEKIDPQFYIVWMDQHGFIYFLTYLLNYFKILAKRFMSKFTQFGKHNLKKL